MLQKGATFRTCVNRAAPRDLQFGSAPEVNAAHDASIAMALRMIVQTNAISKTKVVIIDDNSQK